MADFYRWFPALYEVDTAHLTLAEHGAYRKLIDRYMAGRQPLPDNDRALANLIGCGVDEWLAVATNVRAFFRSKGGRLTQKRCDRELDWQDRQSRTRSEVSAKGVEARRNKNNDLSTGSSTDGRTDGQQPGEPEERRGEERKGDNLEGRDGERVQGEGKKRGTRLPDDWKLPEDWASQTMFAYPGMSIDHVQREGRRFANHFIAKTGADATKIDWRRTWDNWIDRSWTDFRKPPPPPKRRPLGAAGG